MSIGQVFINPGMGCSKEVIVEVYKASVGSYLILEFWIFHSGKDVIVLERVLLRCFRMLLGLEHFSFEESV